MVFAGKSRAGRQRDRVAEARKCQCSQHRPVRAKPTQRRHPPRDAGPENATRMNKRG